MTAGDPRFHGHPLFPWACLAVMARSHRLSRRATVDITQLAEEPVLLLRRGFGSRAAFDDACRIAHIAPPLLLESAAPHSLIALARAGYGVAVIPSPVLLSAAQLRRSGARAVPIVQGKRTVGGWVGVAWDPRRFRAPYAERFVEELTALRPPRLSRTGLHPPRAADPAPAGVAGRGLDGVADGRHAAGIVQRGEIARLLAQIGRADHPPHDLGAAGLG